MNQILEKLTFLLRFQKTDPKEEATVNEILHGELDRLRNANPETQRQWLHLQNAIVESTAAAPVKNPLLPRFAWAMGAAAIVIVSAYFYFSSVQTSVETFSTGRGQQKEIVLNDGSQVRLNYGTELVVPALQKSEARRLSLAGEAFFRVEKNDEPFIVSTGWAEVHVAGTEFNVRAREGVLEVAVVRGIVNVTVVKEGKDSTLVLSEHQIAVCPQNDFPTRAGNIPSAEYPGWMHGKLFLDKTSFLAACREIEMRFDVAVNIQDSTFGEENITGVLDAKTPT
ncbi:MAG: FecR domain-containing protein, partial [Ignavibacteriales bacterium]|nr:FecR domain-containing protein [Ignavibacteriales bacterium]